MKKKNHNNSRPKYLTVKELKPRGGKVSIVFRQHEEPYELSVRDAEKFEPGMRVILYRGKLSPC